jgi:hypothetical protein
MVGRDSEARDAFGSPDPAARSEAWAHWRFHLIELAVILLTVAFVALLVVAAINGEEVGA